MWNGSLWMFSYIHFNFQLRMEITWAPKIKRKTKCRKTSLCVVLQLVWRGDGSCSGTALSWNVAAIQEQRQDYGLAKELRCWHKAWAPQGHQWLGPESTLPGGPCKLSSSVVALSAYMHSGK